MLDANICKEWDYGMTQFHSNISLTHAITCALSLAR